MITEDDHHCYCSPASIPPCCFTHLDLRSLLTNQSPRSPPTYNHSSSNILLVSNLDGRHGPFRPFPPSPSSSHPRPPQGHPGDRWLLPVILEAVPLAAAVAHSRGFNPISFIQTSTSL